MAKKKLTPEEKKNHQDFLELCEYIEKELLHYENNQRLQWGAVNKVRGLAKGQIFANNNQEKYGEYPYEVILLAFKIHKQVILNASNKINSIESETGKVAYMATIIRDKLNDVYSRWINAKKSQEKVETINTDIMEYQGAEYKPNVKANKQEDKYKDLW